MSAQTILIIRHAEKPEPDEASGIDETGGPDGKSLTPQGWQRAGAWAELFVPSLGTPTALPTPDFIFASAPAGPADVEEDKTGSKSRRPLETVTPLALKAGKTIDQGFTKGDEVALAKALSQTAGVSLVCWQHEDITRIAMAIAPDVQGIPAVWPGDRFNVLYRLDRPDTNSVWTFRQVVPVMLKGDESTKI
jgi:hypothetical protein